MIVSFVSELFWGGGLKIPNVWLKTSCMVYYFQQCGVYNTLSGHCKKPSENIEVDFFFLQKKAALFVETLYLPILFMWSKPKYILALIKSNCRSNVQGKQKLDSLLWGFKTKSMRFWRFYLSYEVKTSWYLAR